MHNAGWRSHNKELFIGPFVTKEGSIMKYDSILFHKYHPPSLEFDEDLDEQELFKKAMAEVKPLGGKARPVLGK
mgnify:CR=1 FL=1